MKKDLENTNGMSMGVNGIPSPYPDFGEDEDEGFDEGGSAFADLDPDDPQQDGGDEVDEDEYEDEEDDDNDRGFGIGIGLLGILFARPPMPA